MTNQDLKAIAAKIARDLFTDGAGRRGTRLVMEYRGEHVGESGWSESALADRIAQHLKRRAAGELEGEPEVDPC